MKTDRDLARPDRFCADRCGLTASRLAALVGSAAGRVDYADVFIEHEVTEELLLEDGVVKKASRTISQGAGVRAQAGVRTGYAYTDDLAQEHLELAAPEARSIAEHPAGSAVVPVRPAHRAHDLYRVPEAPVDADLGAKVALLERIDALARRDDSRVRQVIASLWSEEQVVLIATSEGWQLGDVRPLTRPNRPHREGDPPRLHAGPSQCPAPRDAADREWAARVVPAPADAADDEHVHAGRGGGSGRDHPVGIQGSLRRGVRRRPGRHHQRQVRVLSEPGVSDRGRAGHGSRQGRHAD